MAKPIQYCNIKKKETKKKRNNHCLSINNYPSTHKKLNVSNIPSLVYMYHSFLIHSSADGHLGCSHVLAIINSAAMTQRDGTGREEGGGFRMGNTCIPVADSC